jgi:hypothetical protein
VTTDFGGLEAAASDAAVQPDGKLVAVGGTFASQGASDFALARYNADGSLTRASARAGR